MRIHSFMCAVLIVGGAACASSQAEEVRDARMAEVDEQTISKTRAIEEQQEAREEAIEHAHDRTIEKLEAADDATRAAEERAEAAEERASYVSDVRARWETIGVRIDAAQKKMDRLGRKPPVKFENELSSLAKEHQVLKDEVQTVSNIPTSSWENATESLDERLDGLNERVKDLTDSIEDVEPPATTK